MYASEFTRPEDRAKNIFEELDVQGFLQQPPYKAFLRAGTRCMKRLPRCLSALLGIIFKF